MNGDGEWLPVPGWGAAYQVEPHSLRVRSVDRISVNTLGQRRQLASVELKQHSGRVSLCWRGRRRSFPVDELRRLAEAAQE